MLPLIQTTSVADTKAGAILILDGFGIKEIDNLSRQIRLTPIAGVIRARGWRRRVHLRRAASAATRHSS